MAYARERLEQRDIATERVLLLFGQAERLAADGDAEGATKRVRQARDISLRCNLRLPKMLKLRFCRRCQTYFTAKTLQCRLDPLERRLKRTCLSCGHSAYQPYSKPEKGPRRPRPSPPRRT
jgi:RNase P subunit RPR2